MAMLIQSARQRTAAIIGIASISFALLAGAIGLFFLIDADSVSDVGRKYESLAQIDAAIKSLLPVLLLPGKLHGSAVSGALIVLLPLGLGAVPWLYQNPAVRWALIPVVGSLVLAAGVLVLAAERSAWVALACGTLVGLYLYWRFGAGQVTKLRWFGDGALWVGTVLAGFIFFVILVQPAYKLPMGGIAIGGSVISRGELWQEALVIIEDYLFTGSGLGSTAMVFSTYLFLLHVPFLYHAYNLFLQITIEQGAPGAIGFVFMLISAGVGLLAAFRAAYPQRKTLAFGGYLHTVCALTAVSLVSLVVHGMVDAGLYTSALVPVTFFPFALAMMLPQGAPPPKRRGFHEQKSYKQVAAALPFAAVLALLLLPGVYATLHANIGTFSQTKAELSEYSFPEWEIQDMLRRDGHVDLELARKHYQNALQANPTNTTAHRRLGQIALSTGDYGLARQHLEMAYATSPEQRVTRQLLGEAYAAQGDITGAARLWESVPYAFRQHLAARQFWYQSIDAQDELIWLEESIAKVEQ